MCGFICRKWSYAIGESEIVVFFCRLDYTVTECDSFYRGIAKFLTGKLSGKKYPDWSPIKRKFYSFTFLYAFEF